MGDENKKKWLTAPPSPTIELGRFEMLIAAPLMQKIIINVI